MRIVSKQPSPYAKPRSRIGMRASSSGTTAPSSHAKAVRGHLHAVLREGLRVTAELVERLLILRLRIGVRHDPAADGEVGGRTDHSRGADRDVPVEGAVPRDVPESPGVHAPAVGLEAPDDLHRARFGAPVIEPPGNVARMRLGIVTSGRRRPRTTLSRWCTFGRDRRARSIGT